MLTAGQWTFVKTQCLNVGPQGPTGAIGPQGPAGPAGTDGINYGIGPSGQQGPSGCSGPAGPNGADGRNAPDRITELATPRTRSYAITGTRTIPIYLNDKYQTILLNPTAAYTVTLDPYELQYTGNVPNFWVMLKNTTSYDITVSNKTQLAFTLSSLFPYPPDVFVDNASASLIIRGNGSSVILCYDPLNSLGTGQGLVLI